MKLGKAFTDMLTTVAPILGNALGGPLGGAAVKTLSMMLTGKEDTPTDALQRLVLSASPDQLAKIKQAEQVFETRMAELGVDLEKIAAGDRQSAREMQTKSNTLVVPILASFTVAAFFGVVAWVLTGKVSLESTLLGFVLGQVSAKAEQVYNFYFGSSEGSKRKTEKLTGGA